VHLQAQRLQRLRAARVRTGYGKLLKRLGQTITLIALLKQVLSIPNGPASAKSAGGGEAMIRCLTYTEHGYCTYPDTSSVTPNQVAG
jgi:hypothetical protein